MADGGPPVARAVYGVAVRVRMGRVSTVEHSMAIGGVVDVEQVVDVTRAPRRLPRGLLQPGIAKTLGNR